jgi:hypothetical protein
MADAIGEWHYQEGLEQGREQGLEQAARALMAAQGLTPEAALDLLGVDGSLYERLFARLRVQ